MLGSARDDEMLTFKKFIASSNKNKIELLMFNCSYRLQHGDENEVQRANFSEQ
jgi:hypothetical protein